MKVLEMRAFLKGRGVRGYSTLKKSKLEEEVQKIQQEDKRTEYERQLRENALCHACLLSLIHISEPTRLLSISYAVFCLKKK